MSNSDSSQVPAALAFKPDPSSKKKKGEHKPIYAEVFTQKPTRKSDVGCIHLLVNPFAGKRKGKKIGEHVKELLEKEGRTVEIHFSAHSGHLIEVAESIKAQANDIFAVVGGDGSLSEVITGRMMATSEDSELFALIPAGTGNSVANDLGLTSTEQAVRSILHGSYQNLDLAKVEMVEGLPGSEKVQLCVTATILSRGGWVLIQPSRRSVCAGWVQCGTTLAFLWPSWQTIVAMPLSRWMEFRWKMIIRCF